MIGYIYILSTGYDPEHGRNLNDPYLGATPTLGACVPNIRRQVSIGDNIFFVSGKVREAPQFVVGGFEVAQKISALTAFQRFPALRMHRASDGRVEGNVIVNSRGQQHTLDTHAGFERRVQNYIVGRDPVVLTTPDEIRKGREETVDFLRGLFRKGGSTPINIIGRASKLSEDQVLELRHWLLSLKARTN